MPTVRECVDEDTVARYELRLSSLDHDHMTVAGRGDNTLVRTSRLDHGSIVFVPFTETSGNTVTSGLATLADAVLECDTWMRDFSTPSQTETIPLGTMVGAFPRKMVS